MNKFLTKLSASLPGGVAVDGLGSGAPRPASLSPGTCAFATMKPADDGHAGHRRCATLKTRSLTGCLTPAAPNLVACGDEPCFFHVHRVSLVKRSVFVFLSAALHEPLGFQCRLCLAPLRSEQFLQ
jgi:hypothetical protein